MDAKLVKMATSWALTTPAKQLQLSVQALVFQAVLLLELSLEVF